MPEKITELPETEHFEVSTDPEYVHILHNGYELVTTKAGWKKLQKIVNDKIEEDGKKGLKKYQKVKPVYQLDTGLGNLIIPNRLKLSISKILME